MNKSSSSFNVLKKQQMKNEMNKTYHFIVSKTVLNIDG